MRKRYVPKLLSVNFFANFRGSLLKRSRVFPVPVFYYGLKLSDILFGPPGVNKLIFHLPKTSACDFTRLAL